MKLTDIVKVIMLISFIFFTAPVFSETTNTFTDTVITTKIKAKIAMDKTISIFDIGVSTNQGVVTLTGTVHSNSEEKIVIQLAQSTEGVTQVNAKDLTVKKSSHPFKDMIITTKVKSLFIKEKLFGKIKVPVTRINVETNDGTVYLTGTVSNNEEANNAVSLAKSVSGVKNVISRITVASNANT